MKPSPIILFSITLLSLFGTASAEGARESRHLILPYLGYQALNEEEIGYAYTAQIYDLVTDSIYYVSGSGSQERSVNAPVFGLAYRYRFNRLFLAELALAVIHDGKTYKYPISYYGAYGYIQKLKLTVERKNSLLGSLDAAFNMPTPARWLDVGVRVGGGYAWRRIKVKTSSSEVSGSSDDAERMLFGRAGIDLSFWKDKYLVFQTSIFYGYFVPTDTEVDPFGGVGWRASFFPIWSAK